MMPNQMEACDKRWFGFEEFVLLGRIFEALDMQK
jgi:hypothetical protein